MDDITDSYADNLLELTEELRAVTVTVQRRNIKKEWQPFKDGGKMINNMFVF